jgi:hypothetical protein
MIIEDEKGMPENFQYISNGNHVQPEHDANMIQRFLAAHRCIENGEVHTQLQDDLVEYQWLLHNTS